MDGTSVSSGTNLTRTLAERACAVTYDALPEPVRALARQCVLDYLALGSPARTTSWRASCSTNSPKPAAPRRPR